ncbi:unnamed protein product [Hymenolepis diminuta]|uniref:Uncharacterized protein n=1 Tax=Hymenolepis diminuta TaxID=6216 RepID=A0A564Z082_HYMDI|nr:unnamed protein product [Hymenolepis diminuta]
MNQHNPNRSRQSKDVLLSNIKREPYNPQLLSDNTSLPLTNAISLDVRLF